MREGENEIIEEDMNCKKAWAGAEVQICLHCWGLLSARPWNTAVMRMVFILNSIAKNNSHCNTKYRSSVIHKKRDNVAAVHASLHDQASVS